MSHALGTGTANISINLPIDEKGEWGRLACAGNESLGNLIRRLMLRGLESELACAENAIHREIGFISWRGEILMFRRAEALRQTVRKVKEIRRTYYGVMLALVFCGGLICCEQVDMRRCRTRVEEMREEA